MRSPLRLPSLFRLTWPGRRHRRRGSARVSRPESTARIRLGRTAKRSSTHDSVLAWVPWRRLVLVVFVVVLLSGAVVAGVVIVSGDTFRVQQVRVDDLEVTDAFAVVAAADVDGKSLLWIDTTEVARRVAELPAVYEARVNRDWPRGILITLVEEQGWGYWQRGDIRRVINAEGRVLTEGRLPERDAVTIFELGTPDGMHADLLPDRDSVQLVNRLLEDGVFQRVRVRPEAFVFRHDRGLTVVVEGGPNALVGDSHDYEFKIAAWGALLDRIEREHLDVTEIDMRFGRHLVLR